MSHSSYTIHVRVIQTKPKSWFNIVEKTVWKYANGGTWCECEGEQILTMGGSGTSGTLRFMNPHGEYFLVALGVHNYKRWCDIVPDLSPSNTGVEIHPTYYSEGSGNRNDVLAKQLAHLEKTTRKNTKVTVDYYEENGNDMRATITIAA